MVKLNAQGVGENTPLIGFGGGYRCDGYIHTMLFQMTPIVKTQQCEHGQCLAQTHVLLESNLSLGLRAQPSA